VAFMNKRRAVIGWVTFVIARRVVRRTVRRKRAALAARLRPGDTPSRTRRFLRRG
jgi:hypothetical protein